MFPNLCVGALAAVPDPEAEPGERLRGRAFRWPWCLWLLAVAGAVLPAQAGARGSFEDECEKRVPRGQIRVIAAPMEPRFDTTRSYRELTEEAGKEGLMWVLGLTQPTLRVQIRWGFNGLTERRTGLACIRPSLEMNLRYDPVNVYVGREFLGDDCAYGFIFRHEMRHVAVHVRKLREVADQLRRDLAARLGGELHYGSESVLRKRLDAEISNYWLPRAERELKNVRREHEAIDTPEEYGRARTVCGGSIARFLPPRR